MVKLECPSCKLEVPSISYSKQFIFVDGVRHSVSWTWELGCCGGFLLDDDLGWNFEEQTDGLFLSSLLDKEGAVVLGWLDQVPPEAEEAR